MIGKSLRERHGVGVLGEERAVALVKEVLASHAEPLVQVRAKDARMVACVVVQADEPAVRLCKSLGLAMKPGGTGVLGLLGADATKLFPHLSAPQQAWLGAPCGPRETKVLLLAGGGTALLSIEAKDGKVAITPFSPAG
jgi:hypothetical protein